MTRETTNENPEPLKRLMSGAILSLVFGALGYLLMFLFKAISARIFGPDQFGMFELGTTILNIGALAASLGIQASVGRYLSVYEERGETDKLGGYLRFIFQFPILAALFVATGLFMTAPAIRDFFGFDQIFITIIRIVALTVPFRVANEIIYQIFYAKNRVLAQNVSNNLAERVIPLIGLIFVHFYSLSVSSLMWLFFLSIFLVFLSNLIFLKLNIRFEKAKKFQNDYKEWLKFSLPLLLANLFAFVINWTDNIAIGKIMTSRDVGIYAVSFSLASFLLFFQTSFSSVFYPIISRLYAQDKNDEISIIYGKAQNWAFGMALPFALIFIFFSRDILVGIYGKAYSEASLPLIILTISFLFNVYTGMNAALLRLKKDTSFIFKTKLVIAILNAIMMIFLIRKFGILGAAVSVSLSLALEQIIYMMKAKKYLKLFHNNVSNLKIFAMGMILILIFSQISFSFGLKNGSIPDLLIVFLSYFTVYLAVILATRTLSEDDLIIFKQLLGNGKNK